MAQTIEYVTAGEVKLFNAEVLRLAGKTSAFLREEGLLDSALTRPRNAAYYEHADIVTQAALYMVGIALNHPFVDGNKRTGFMTGMVFLARNGVIAGTVNLDYPEMGIKLERVVRRELSFKEFVRALRTYIKKK